MLDSFKWFYENNLQESPDFNPHGLSDTFDNHSQREYQRTKEEYKEIKTILKKGVGYELFYKEDNIAKRWRCWAVLDNDKVIGDLEADDLIKHPYPFPKVWKSVVDSEFQGKGVGTTLYQIMIEQFGGLIGSFSLSGNENKTGSFHIWQKLSQIYNSYIIKFEDDYENSTKKKTVIPVENFLDYDRSKINSNNEVFMVTKEPISQENLKETPEWNDLQKEMGKELHYRLKYAIEDYNRAKSKGQKFYETQIGNYIVEAYYVEEYVNKYYEVFALNNNDGSVAGAFAAEIKENSPSPVVNYSYIFESHQRKGLALTMYKIVIEKDGRLFSDKTLTGENRNGGSFDIWKKLGEIYQYRYVYSERTKKFTPVETFERSQMVDRKERFVVSKEPIENELQESSIINKIFTESNDAIKTWYHGTPHKIEKFSDDFVGQGDDQEGPGIYFTSGQEDAYGYAKKEKGPGEIFIVELNFKKLVPNKGTTKIKEIKQMMEWAPRLSEILTDWDEDPKVAFSNALKSMMRQENPVQSFLSVWYDFYRNEPIEFVRNMVTLGYDGIIVQRGFMNVKHAIVYNPKIIKVIERIDA